MSVTRAHIDSEITQQQVISQLKACGPSLTDLRRNLPLFIDLLLAVYRKDIKNIDTTIPKQLDPYYFEAVPATAEHVHDFSWYIVTRKSNTGSGRYTMFVMYALDPTKCFTISILDREIGIKMREPVTYEALMKGATPIHLMRIRDGILPTPTQAQIEILLAR